MLTIERRCRILLGLFCCLMAGLVSPLDATESEASESHEKRGLYVGSQRSWFFVSFLPENDQAETLGLELESYVDTRKYSIKNISYLEVADYPRPIPGQPPGNIFPGLEVKTGISDLLMGFWVSKKGKHHGKHHLAWGGAAQFPTASSESLGSGKWSAGPSLDYEYTSGRLFAGFIALNLWSFAGDSDRKEVNYFMAKPFVVYAINDKWDALYMPYGISVYWNKPSGEDIYLPVGGGLQRHLGQSVNISLQFFKNVLRPSKGTEYDLRFMLEFVF
ncbi:MAG: hypothetical protein WBH75_03885 [Thermoanaerobaculia bacterium]